MIQNIDRVAVNPNRKLITPESGDPFYATVEWADNPTQTGTIINKTKLDEILAATGTTGGTKSAFTLEQAGFELLDGAVIRFKIHVRNIPPFTINVNSTGDIPVVNMKGAPTKSYPEDTWFSAIYNSVTGNFQLLGDGSDAKQRTIYEIFMVKNYGLKG